MPVLMDSGPSGHNIRAMPERVLEIGLVNNMPDAALESTERQFLDLLRAAAGDIPVRLRLYFIPEVPRAETGRQYIAGGYRSIDELWNSRLDGLIVTGTEPRTLELSDEPYWRPLTRLLDWAQASTASTVWSCLAAHAAVLHMDGIRRRLLDEKRFGVFECARSSDHALLAGVPPHIRIAHSRCNELAQDALAGCGYSILTRSAEAGVDAFVKEDKSLFVFFQGHPEYDERALLREYRRDVGRYLRRERETYPHLPRGYFDRAATAMLNVFRDVALEDRREALLERFPLGAVEARLTGADRAPVVRLYRNWLDHLGARKAQRRPASPIRPGSRRLEEPAHGLG
jgi:homoserine O-succinyltransferase